MTGVLPQPTEAAKAAYARHDWREAYARYAEADAARRLEPADLVDYADAAWWTGEPDEAFRLRERAYAAYVDARDRRTAARVALLLFMDCGMRHMESQGRAWLARAERCLEGDTDSAEYGRFLVSRAMLTASVEGGSPTADARAALDLGTRHGDKEVVAAALTLQGQALVAEGDVLAGKAMINEATVAAVSGELGLFMTGWVYCNTISTYRDLADFRSANEWTEAAHRWCDRQSVTGFPGICRVHRADILALRGALSKAEQEARLATAELMRFQIRPVVAESLYEVGAIRLRMGDLPAAEVAFRQAHELGRIPEPGLSLLRLAEGKPAVAYDELRRVLGEVTARGQRGRILPVAVDAALAAGETAAAERWTEDLEAVAEAFDSAALRAYARTARGGVLIARGDSARAEGELRKALAFWQELDAPYEAAQVRMRLAEALRAQGRGDAATLELGAASSTFERIGARRDVSVVAALLGTDAAPAAESPRVTRTFLFSDIVGSTKLAAAIGDDAWKDLIRWHDEALRALIATHRGEEIRHQGDGFVVSFDDPGSAIDCAIAIQRRLAEHRRTEGFAPAVRIGVHETDAVKRGLDYAGVGVHEAARVGAAAEGGEILVTRATLSASGREYATGEARRVELKGIEGQVEIVPLSWT